MPEPLPFIPGHEAAGIVSSVGSQVSGVTVGDRVAWGYPGVLGGYAERVAVPAQWIVPLPPQIDLSTAAAVLIQGMTAHYLSHAAYPVRPGDTVLVHCGRWWCRIATDPDGQAARRPGHRHGLHWGEGEVRKRCRS